MKKLLLIVLLRIIWLIPGPPHRWASEIFRFKKLVDGVMKDPEIAQYNREFLARQKK